MMEAGTRSSSQGRWGGWLDASIPPLSTPNLAAAVGMGVALSGAALIHFGLSARGVTSVLFVAGLTAIGFIDFEHRVIPNRIVVPLTAVILILQLTFFSDQALEWVISGAGAALLLAIPAYVRPGSVGMGDVKLALLLGVGLGQAVITALFLGSLAAVPVSLWILARRGLDARKQMIPIGPFLAAGGILALFISSSL